MKILFWNTHNNCKINPFLSGIIKDNEIDIVVLAEYTADERELLELVQKNQQQLKVYPSIGCDRIKFFGNRIDVEPAVQDKYYSIQIIDKKYILCGVHLPSNLEGDKSNERFSIARKMMSDLHEEEYHIGSSHTIIVGDLNEMPYDNSCMNAEAFHGLPVFTENSESRIVLNNSYKKYYNPMWNLFGDFSYPPGTYYRNDSSLFSPMWYMLDQFIFGYDIVPLIVKTQLKIITDCSNGPLRTQHGHPSQKISDHFPIMCEISD